MNIPQLVFQEVDQNNEIKLVKPDKKHVHPDDYYTYGGTSPISKERKPIAVNWDDLSNSNSIVDNTVRSIINDDDDDDAPTPSYANYAVADEKNEDDVFTISKLNEIDYEAVPDRRSSTNIEPEMESFSPSLDFNYSQDDIGAVSSSLRSDHFFPSTPIVKEDTGGLWFKGHTPLPSDAESGNEDLSKQYDKILTFDSEFALPVICQPFVEKQQRQNRSFGEKDFSRHRKSNTATHPNIFEPQKKHHKLHKHKHHKEKDEKAKEEKDNNKENKRSTSFKKETKPPKEKKRQRSSSLNASSILAMMPLSDIADTSDKENDRSTSPKKELKPPKEKKRPRSASFNTSSMMAMMPMSDVADMAAENVDGDTNKPKLTKARSMTLHQALFTDGGEKEKEKEKERDKSKHRHRHHHKKHHHASHLKNRGLSAQDTLESRIRSGMHALEEERKALREIVEEMDENIGERDREDITSHRFGNFHQKHDPFESMSTLRPRRHHHSGMLTHVSDLDAVSICSVRPAKPHMHIDMENTLDVNNPTQYSTLSDKEKSGFVELEELTTTESNELQWKERARWIKFEEDVEKNERWGKPHVASLSFQSLIELRRGLETGTVLLNLDNYDLPTIYESVVENLIITDQIPSSMREKITNILLSKHCHHHQNKVGLLRRRPSTVSMQSGSQSDKESGLESGIEPGMEMDEVTSIDLPRMESVPMIKMNGSNSTNCSSKNDLKLTNPMTTTNHVSADNYLAIPIPILEDQDKVQIVKFAPAEEPQGGDPKTESNVKERIPVGAEATSVLVATVEDMERPAMAFVRLSKGCYLGNLTEVSIPVRFLFVIMGPPSNHDYFEIGRSIATLMSDKIFHDLAYSAKKRDDILAAINSFLDDSIVLSPGDWDRHLLLPLLQAEISEKRRERIKLLKETAEWQDPDEENPLERTGHIFGGFKREVKKKVKYIKSDFLDGFNMRCLITVIFCFFATFAPTITFGALLEKKTKNNLGVMETLLATSMSGVLFGLFSGQPLMIVGTTGPILVFEQATYDLSYAFKIDFLTWRVWIGLWVMVILWGVVAFEGCFLVEHFTRFTEEVFSVLISLLFVYEAIYFLVNSFKKNPLTLQQSTAKINLPTNSSFYSVNDTATHYKYSDPECDLNKPNVALISTLLLLGTFFIAYYLRKLRVSHFLSSKARRVLADFGVPFAMVLMVGINLTHDVSDVPKLKFKRGIEPTKDTRHEYFVNPFQGLDVSWMIVALFPALCVSILLFMETLLTGVLLNKRKNKLKKGGGYNMDLFVMGLLCGICSLLGLPWMCAATVRSVQHQNALAIMSRSHAPGERPYLLRIIEQRLTNVSIHVLIGICVAAYPIIEEVPLATCFGVFLYLGISSLSGIQFIEQLELIFVPSKYHPNRKYIRNVKYSSLVWYTLIQMVCLITLIIVKLSPHIAPAFPFVIIGMVFLRRFIERYFSEDELEDLDNEDDGDFDDYDEYGVSLPC